VDLADHLPDSAAVAADAQVEDPAVQEGRVDQEGGLAGDSYAAVKCARSVRRKSPI